VYSVVYGEYTVSVWGVYSECMVWCMGSIQGVYGVVYGEYTGSVWCMGSIVCTVYLVSVYGEFGEYSVPCTVYRV
jgi:hypothetical protein